MSVREPKKEKLDEISGFYVRPGNYRLNGARALRGGVNFKAAFTEQYAFSVSLLYDKTGPGIRAGVLFFVN